MSHIFIAIPVSFCHVSVQHLRLIFPRSVFSKLYPGIYYGIKDTETKKKKPRTKAADTKG